MDLYLVKVSYVSSHFLDRKCFLSPRIELAEEEPGFLFALVLNFLPTLGAMEKKKKKNQGRLH